MRSVSGGLVTLLNSQNVFTMADLYTFTMLDGTYYRWTAADRAITVGGIPFSAQGPVIERGTTRVTASLEVDTLDITLLVGDDPVLIGGVPLLAAAMNGAFDGARVKLERIFMPEPGDTSLGTVVLFEGAVAGVSPSSTRVELTIKSELEKLNTQLPHNLYMPACSHALYDAGCGLSRSNFTDTASVGASPSPTTLAFASGLSEADGYYDLGVVAFTAGANLGVRRAVKSYVGNVVTLALPLPHAPAEGDAFTIYPGCKKSLTVCKTKFGNSDRFRGFPYVPRPEQTI